jgi:hypothetical protein
MVKRTEDIGPFDSFRALIGSLTKGKASPYVAGYDDHDYVAAKDAIAQASEADRAEARSMISGSLTVAVEAIPYPDEGKTRLRRLVDTIPREMVDFCWSVVVAMDLGAARRGVPAPSLPDDELTADQRRSVDSLADSHMQRIYRRADQSHLKSGLIHIPGFDWLLGAGIHVFRAFTFFFFYIAQKLHLNYLLLWLPIWLVAWVADFLTFSLPWAFFAVTAWLTRGQVPSIRENDRWYGCWCFGTSLLARLDYAKTWTTPSHRDLIREHLLLVGLVATAARGAALAETMGQRPTPAPADPGVASPVTFGHRARWWAPRCAVLLYFPLAFLLLSNWHPGEQSATRRARMDTGSAFSQTPPRPGQAAPSPISAPSGSRGALDEVAVGRLNVMYAGALAAWDQSGRDHSFPKGSQEFTPSLCNGRTTDVDIARILSREPWKSLNFGLPDNKLLRFLQFQFRSTGNGRNARFLAVIAENPNCAGSKQYISRRGYVDQNGRPKANYEPIRSDKPPEW